MKPKNILVKTIIFIFLIAIMAFNIFAVGVAPSRKVVDYEVGKTITGEIRVVNNDESSFTFIVYPSGELSEYVKIDGKDIITMQKSDFEKKINYVINLPSNITPGTNKISLVVSQLDTNIESEKTSIVKSVVNLNAQIIVNVPYPGKYLRPELFITNTELDQDTLFSISSFNLGSQKLNQVRAIVNIKTTANELITSLDTNIISLEPSAESKIIASWKGVKNPGKYIAEIIILYDGENQKITKDFELGGPSITIKDFKVPSFRLGGIAKFDMTIRNNWNEPLSDVYMDLTITQNEEFIDKIRSVPETLNSYDDVLLSAYWDTTGINQGPYKILSEIFFEGKSKEEPFDIYVGYDGIAMNSLSAQVVAKEKKATNIVKILTFLVILLIIINVSWLVIYFKKKAK